MVDTGTIDGQKTSESKSELDYETAGNEGLSYTAGTTGVHPNFGMEALNGSRLQFIAEFGNGHVGLDHDGYRTEMLDSSYASFGASGDHTLFSSRSLLNGGTSELSLEGETLMASQFISNGNGVFAA